MAAGAQEGGWRTRAQAQVRSQSPAPAAVSPVAATGLPKLGGASGGWRERMAAKEKQAVTGASLPATPTASLPPESKRTQMGSRQCPRKRCGGPNRSRHRKACLLSLFFSQRALSLLCVCVLHLMFFHLSFPSQYHWAIANTVCIQ